MANLIGQQFGNYQLIQRLGKGGFGEVYLGRHIHIQRDAAIKLLLNLEQDEIEQFRQEAQIIAKLTHPRIVTIFDYDVAGETPFIVMQYAAHGTLRGLYQRGTQVPLVDVVKFVLQAAEGLQFAHDQQVIHRDIKPENMLLGPSGDLLLSDFGIAVMWSGTRSIGTQNASGTLAYMPAEQITKHPRPASDQYALAITAYEWLSGERPMSESKMGLGVIQMQYPAVTAPPLRQLLPHLPQQVDDVLQHALASDWQARYATVRNFAQAFERAASTGARLIQAGYTTRPDTQATLPTTPPLDYNLLGPAQLWQAPGYAGIAPPPPPESYNAMPQGQIFAYPPPIVSLTPLPVQSSVWKKTLTVLMTMLRIIGIITGGCIALFGMVGFLISLSDKRAITDVGLANMLVSFGLLVIFIALIRKTSFPVSKARKIKARVGLLATMSLVLLASGAIIATILNPGADYGGIQDGQGFVITCSIITFIFSAVTWWVTRIRIKQTP